MKKRILFLVNTPLQLIIAIRLLFHEYGNGEYEADLILTDRINNYERLVTCVREAGCFKNVWAEKLAEHYPNENRVKLFGMRFAQMWGKRIRLETNESYDLFLFGNVHYENSIIYRELRRRNSEVKVFMFEDGYGTYAQEFATRLSVYDDELEQQLLQNMEGFKPFGFSRKLFYHWTKEVYYHIQAMYVFEPAAMDYRPWFPVLPIKKIDRSEQKMIDLLNRVFGYYESLDIYDKKIIFFEESYYGDGIPVDDVTCVQKLARICGKENIMVKIHPRNKENRFKDMGYKTNENTYIPWEVIALNLNLQDKILVTIASGSAVVALMNMGVKSERIVMLMNCEEMIKPDRLSASAKIIERVATQYKDVVLMPQTMEEFEMIWEDLDVKPGVL